MSQVQPFYILHEQDTIMNSTYTYDPYVEIVNMITPKFYDIMDNLSNNWEKDPDNILKENPFSYDKNNFKFECPYFLWCGFYNVNQVKNCKFILAYIVKNAMSSTDSYHDEKNPNKIFTTNNYKIVLFTDPTFIKYCEPHTIKRAYCEDFNFKIDIPKNFNLGKIENDQTVLTKDDLLLLLNKLENFVSSNKELFYIILDDKIINRLKAKNYIFYIQEFLNRSEKFKDIFPKELCSIVQNYLFSYNLSFHKEVLKYDINIEKYDTDYTNSTEILTIVHPTIKDLITTGNINDLIRDELSTTTTDGVTEIKKDTLDYFTWNVTKWVLELEIKR